MLKPQFQLVQILDSSHSGDVLNNLESSYLHQSHIALDRLCSQLMISDDDSQHLHLSSNLAVFVHIIEGILLKECNLEHSAYLEYEVLAVRQGIRTDKLHYLLKLDFLLEQFHDRLG